MKFQRHPSEHCHLHHISELTKCVEISSKTVEISSQLIEISSQLIEIYQNLLKYHGKYHQTEWKMFDSILFSL